MAFFLAIVFFVIGSVLVNTPNEQQAMSAKEYNRKHPPEDATHEYLLKVALASEYHRRGLYPGIEDTMANKNARLRMLDLGLRPYNFFDSNAEYPNMKTFNRDSSAKLFEPGPIGAFSTNAWDRANSAISRRGDPVYKTYVLNLTFNKLCRDYKKEFPKEGLLTYDDMRESYPLCYGLPDGFLNPDGTIQRDRLEALADARYQEIISEANEIIDKAEAGKVTKDASISQAAPTPEWARQQLKEKYGIDYPGKQ